MGAVCLSVADEVTGSEFGFIDEANAEGITVAIEIEINETPSLPFLLQKQMPTPGA